jgi:hypothetical protein
MKNLRFNFEEGKQRVIVMLEEHIDSFTHDMLQDIGIVINRDKDETVDQIEDIIESIRLNSNACENAILKVKSATSIIEVIEAMDGTGFEGMEETVLNELFGLESVTID